MTEDEEKSGQSENSKKSEKADKLDDSKTSGAIGQSEQSEKPESSEESEQKIPKKANPVRLITFITLIIAIGFFILYILSDRYTPYSDQATINGLVNPISPRVSGFLTEIRVGLHSHVDYGDTLFQIDRRPLEIAVRTAEANLDNVAQSVNARTASVKSAAGHLGVARAQLDRAQRNYNRIEDISNKNPGAISQADRDQAETGLNSASEQVASAEANLERAEQALGDSGPENAQFRSALTQLENAQLNLAFSTVIAEVPGVIESMYVDKGYYSQAGQPIATLVSDTDYWIEANLKENNLSHLNIGDKVEFSLDVDPGHVFEGTVRSIGYGVSSGSTSRGDLPNPKGASGWLRDPQRFPVIISFDNSSLLDRVRIGGQVDVVAYASDQGFLNTLGRWRIRLNSWLSYVR